MIRDQGMLGRGVEGGLIENAYTLRIMNSDEKLRRYRIAVSGLNGIALGKVPDAAVDAASTHSLVVSALVVSARVSPEAGAKGSLPIRFDIEAAENPSLRRQEKAVFIMP
ncbi:FixG Ig-like domain-containing protein [Sulfuritalea sp.]|uniref:FixG Ig-like domain-containing protein n=1 Tax=Sulfuritalea sp. TaxID=2480090 RepID=UPI00286E1064|nr:FixG Ig-like domain-containing protein [Sulfuritalea sp.]